MNNKFIDLDNLDTYNKKIEALIQETASNLETLLDLKASLDENNTFTKANTFNSTCTFKGANTYTADNGANQPTNKFNGGLSVGNALSNGTARYFVYRKAGTKSYTYMTANSVGYDPKENTSETTDYGMKLEVKVIPKATVSYPTTTGSNNVGTFYLSHNGCKIAYSGDPEKTFTTNQVYDVLDTRNMFDYVIEAMTENKKALTQEQQEKILSWLGILPSAQNLDDGGQTGGEVDEDPGTPVLDETEQ